MGMNVLLTGRLYIVPVELSVQNICHVVINRFP